MTWKERWKEAPFDEKAVIIFGIAIIFIFIIIYFMIFRNFYFYNKTFGGLKEILLSITQRKERLDHYVNRRRNEFVKRRN